jgi:hypothetical protein
MTLQRRYSPDDLRAFWSFVQRDFERFLEFLVWLDSLPAGDAKVQIKAARWLRTHKAGA